jgi:hypothetical protein
MSKIKKPKRERPTTTYATFRDLSNAWRLRADAYRFGEEHAAANVLEGCALEMEAMAGVDMIRPTLIAYAWKDIQGIGGKIGMEVSFTRPFGIPTDAITVLHGPAIPEQDMVTGANLKSTDQLRLEAILEELKSWKGLKDHFLGQKTIQGNGSGYGISVAIDAVDKILAKYPDSK